MNVNYVSYLRTQWSWLGWNPGRSTHSPAHHNEALPARWFHSRYVAKQGTSYTFLFICLYRRLVSSFGRVRTGVWKVEGSEPQTGPTLRVLNLGECAAFVISSANG